MNPLSNVLGVELKVRDILLTFEQVSLATLRSWSKVLGKLKERRLSTFQSLPLYVRNLA